MPEQDPNLGLTDTLQSNQISPEKGLRSGDSHSTAWHPCAITVQALRLPVMALYPECTNLATQYTFHFSLFAVIVPIIQQSSWRYLNCPHPNCLSTFKSQHGRTHHIHAMHLNTHASGYPINGRHHGQNGQEYVYHSNDDEFDGVDSPDTGIDSTALPPNDERNDPGRLSGPQRIEHPHLNGMSARTYKSLGIP